MTDNEKLDLILAQMGSINERLDNLESKIDELGHPLNVTGINAVNVENAIKDVQRQQMKDTAEIKAISGMIFDEVVRVHYKNN